MSAPSVHPTSMPTEVVEWMVPEIRRTIVDATAGHGGHSVLFAPRRPRDGLLVLIDSSGEALARACERLEGCGVRVLPVQGNYRDLAAWLSRHGVSGIDGVLYDQGLSSDDLSGQAGFSFAHDAPLDMRRDADTNVTAAHLLNSLGARDLARIFQVYGEERWAARIASFVVDSRAARPFERTGEFVDTVQRAVPRAAWPRERHVATKCMMALRYAVTGDLESIRTSIISIAPQLRPGGRILAISFCSLEDRVVKQAFQHLANPCTCPSDAPMCVCGAQPVVRILTRRPVTPTPEEVAANRWVRSAKLRVAERIETGQPDVCAVQMQSAMRH